LQKSGIPEANGYAGFPVSGIWLRCDDPAINKRHHAKVYGKADVGSPPMSVPHLDTRVIGASHSILFGPYAGFATKFLKRGSYLDLFRSIRFGNILPMMEVGLHNFNLDEYLVDQVVQSPKQRFETLMAYYPLAQQKDWQLQQAGMRVQIIKRDPQSGGILKFGTEIVAASDRSLVALLGASPGASTAASIMIKVLELCFATQLNGGWRTKLQQIIPSYGHSLIDDAALTRQVRADTAAVLGLQNV
jgi:malate dehydrogenase (quinone)